MAVQKIPTGSENFIPHLVCDPCAAAIEFYKKAFGAEEMNRVPDPSGKRIMHAAMRIGKCVFFMADDFPEFCGGMSQTPKALKGTPVTIHRYVEDVDAAVKQAAEAGAKPVMPVMDMFWGDRYGIVEDPFGHKWSMATHLKDLTPEEIAAGMKEAFAHHNP